jgi:hypothetical protein
VLFIGADTLWRWQTIGPRSDDGATLYAIFWQQALRALAPPEPSSVPVQVWLRPDRTHYQIGDRVRLAVETVAPAEQALTSVEAVVILPDGKRLPLDLAADGRSPNRFTSNFAAGYVGRYRLEATASAGSQPVAMTSTVIEVSAGSRTEADDATVDALSLARLATATGGRVIDPASAEGWLPKTTPSAATVVRSQPVDLWHNFTLLLVLCSLFAADWVLRLFKGFT